MSQQSKALLRLCQSVWRVGGHSSSHVASLDGQSTICVRRWLTFPQRPISPSSQPAIPSSLPCLNTKNAGSRSDPCQEWENNDTSVGFDNPGQRHGERVRSLLLGLSLRGQEAEGGASLKARASEKFSSSDELTSSFKRKWDLASWPHKEHLEYVCPSEKLTTLPELAILDNLPTSTTPYDLPHTPNLIPSIIDPTATITAEISEPPTANNADVPKEARAIMKIRRKKMKRHLLKKYRKRMKFTLRKIKRERRKKKEAVFQARLAGIREWGDSFSAHQWVHDHLEKARKGGFYINVLDK